MKVAVECVIIDPEARRKKKDLKNIKTKSTFVPRCKML